MSTERDEELAREGAVEQLLVAKASLHQAYQSLAEGRVSFRGLITPLCGLIQQIVDMIDRDFDHYRRNQ